MPEKWRKIIYKKLNKALLYKALLSFTIDYFTHHWEEMAMKKIKQLALTVLLATFAFWGSGLFTPTGASAQDVWIHTFKSTGQEVYVRDDTVTWTPRTAQIGSMYIKWVNANGKCVANEKWTFSSDEGYLWASNGKNSFAIACHTQHWGNSPIQNRPDLLAAYRWLIRTYANRTPDY